MPIEAMPLAGGFASGGIIGGIIGFTFKKLAQIIKKAIMVLIGIQLTVFAVAEHYGLVTVDWEGTQAALVGFFGWAGDMAADTAPSLMDTVLASAPLSGGLLGGVLLGYKFG